MKRLPRTVAARARRGVTLIEVMIALVLTGALAATAAPAFAPAAQQVDEARLRAGVVDVATAADGLLARAHRYPGAAGAFAPEHAELAGVRLAPTLEYRIAEVDDDGRGARAEVRGPDTTYVCVAGLGRRATPTALCGAPDLVAPAGVAGHGTDSVARDFVAQPVAVTGPSDVVVGTAAAFTTASADPSLAWAFGDGTTGTGPNPSVTYADVGTYTVTLTSRDAEGRARMASHAVNVLPDAATDAVFMHLYDYNVRYAASEPWLQHYPCGLSGDPASADYDIRGATSGYLILREFGFRVDRLGALTNGPWELRVDWGDGSTGRWTSASLRETSQPQSNGMFYHAFPYGSGATFTVRATLTDRYGRVTGGAAFPVSTAGPAMAWTGSGYEQVP